MSLYSKPELQILADYIAFQTIEDSLALPNVCNVLPVLQVGDDLMLLYVISEEVLDHRTSLEINRFQYCQDNLDISLEYGPVIKK